MGTCFVAMPISTPDEYTETYHDRDNHFGHVLDYLFSPAIENCGYEVVSPRASGADLIHAGIIRNLEQADLVLCDISCLNPNVFFELGIRTALDRPVAIVKDNHTQRIPFDTASINTYTYDASLMPWSLATQIPSLSEHIRQSIEGAGGRNPLWRYFGLTQQAAPPDIANPTEAKLELILSELTELRRPPQPADPISTPRALRMAIETAYDEAYGFGRKIDKDASELWTESVLARRPRIPADLEDRLLQESKLPMSALRDERVRTGMREGFWAAIDAITNGREGS
jgi:hypothetical protein